MDLGTNTTTRSRLSNLVPHQILDHTRKLGLSLLRTFAECPTYVLGVTSAVRGEGKTTITLALSEVMATDFGLEVVVLDTHAENSWSRYEAELGNKPGLSDWLSGECQLQEGLVPVHDKYSLLPFGTQSITSRDLLQYLIRSDGLTTLRERFGLIMVDLPDLSNPAGAALASQCDGLVLVVRSGDTPRDVVRSFLPALQNLTMHGVVLNRHISAIPTSIGRLFF